MSKIVANTLFFSFFLYNEELVEISDDYVVLAIIKIEKFI